MALESTLIERLNYVHGVLDTLFTVHPHAPSVDDRTNWLSGAIRDVCMATLHDAIHVLRAKEKQQ